MSRFRRAKPKLILTDLDVNDDLSEEAPMVPMKTEPTFLKAKRNKVSLPFSDDLKGHDLDQDDEVAVLPMKSRKASHVFRARQAARNPADDTSMDVDKKIIYSSTYLEELKAQNKIKQDNNPTNKKINNAFQIMEMETAAGNTKVLSDLEVNELKDRKQRGNYQEMQMAAEDDIRDEDNDEDFIYLDTMKKGTSAVDKHVDFEVDLHEDFADQRLALSSTEHDLQRKQKQDYIETALDNAYTMESDNRRLKPIVIGAEVVSMLKQKIEDCVDVEEHTKEQIAKLISERDAHELKRKELSTRIDSLAKQYI